MAPQRQLGQRLRQFRQAHRLSQRAFAQRCGLTQSQVSKIERGEQQLRVEMLHQILTAFDLPLATWMAIPTLSPALQEWLALGRALPADKREAILLMLRRLVHGSPARRQLTSGAEPPEDPPKGNG